MIEPIVIDFETYYDKEYSLSKISTEAYIRDPRFEVIMLGIRMPDGTKGVITGTRAEIKYKLDVIPWHEHAVVAHNALFDAAIMSWVFDIRPGLWLDTLAMANAIHHGKSNSLSALAERYKLQEKGAYVNNMVGRHRLDITRAEFKQYAQYCMTDLDLCHDLFYLMSEGYYDIDTVDMRDRFPKKELELIDTIIRMFTEPVLRLNEGKLQTHLDAVIAKKQGLLAAAAEDKDILMSNPKFAELLQSLGVTPPMKVSKTTGKPAYAFAKTDPGLKELLEHPDERVQAIVAARMGVKSTLEETRTQRFIDIAKRDPLFPVPLKYSAARTHRMGGTDGINLQNLPARSGKQLKSAIEAPPGYLLVDCDSSNIEARMLAWLAQQDDLVTDFANKVDVYCKMASHIYNMTITKDNSRERFVGKTVTLGCLAEGTLVLCERGWTPIEKVTAKDRVWDGLTWVTHQGLLKKGLKKTLNIFSLWLTPDHQVLCGTEWKDAQSVLQDESSLCQILDTGAANLPLQATWPDQIGEYHISLLDVIVDGQSFLLHKTTSKALGAQDVICAPSKSHMRPSENCTGCMQKSCQTTNTGLDSLIGSQPLSAGATYPRTECTKTMVGEVYLCTSLGVKTEKNFLGISKPLKDGISQNTKWIVQTTIKDTSPEILGSCLGTRTSGIVEKLQLCKKELTNSKKYSMTYDLIMSGPRNRFTVWTERGPVIVHNCGYQTGAGKLQATLKAATPSVDLPIEECKRIVDTYREVNYMIPRLWREADRAIQAMHDDQGMWLGREGVVWVDGRRGIKLPNGMYIQYPQLHKRPDPETGKLKWVYKDRAGLADIYGGKLIENCLAAGTLVLTDRGWVAIESVKLEDKVHDGVEFVTHGGTVFKSIQSCVKIDGVLMTPDHKVLTNDGWIPASQNPRPYRPEIRNAPSARSRPKQWSEKKMAFFMRLRKKGYERRYRCKERSKTWGDSELWMRDKATYVQQRDATWYEQTSSICSMAFYAGSVSPTYTPSMEKLWGAWDKSMRSLAGFLSKFLGRHGANLFPWARFRQDRQRRRLQPRELSMGYSARERHEQTEHYTGGRCPETKRRNWYFSQYNLLQTPTWMDSGTIKNSPASYKPVYDIINCGPRRRFVVAGENGPFVVHNCVQALARIVVMYQLLNIKQRYKVALTVHDSVLAVVPEHDTIMGREYIEQCMRWVPKWAGGCPINCESKIGHNYGEMEE